jgi:hypothetical protein
MKPRSGKRTNPTMDDCSQQQQQTPESEGLSQLVLQTRPSDPESTVHLLRSAVDESVSRGAGGNSG